MITDSQQSKENESEIEISDQDLQKLLELSLEFDFDWNEVGKQMQRPAVECFNAYTSWFGRSLVRSLN